jgi:hypothetical protein
MNKKNRARLTVEALEARNLLTAYYGLTWPNPGHLTLSFAPDGTGVDGYQSALSRTLGSQLSTRTWQMAVLQAMQTWAVNTNINIGVVADGGQALGTPGPAQGDTRFGDIRVAAEPMGLAAPLATTAPYNPMAGTRSGDMVFNSSQAFNLGGQGAYDLFTVALHEAGHDFGLPDQTTDPTCVMYSQYLGPRTGLSASDVALIQSLYGAPTPDQYQGTTGNGTFSTAAPMKLPDVAGDLTTPNQAEFFQFQVPSHANRTVTVKVQTSGLSLLTPRLSIYNANQQLIATSSVADPLSGDVAITLSNVKRGTVLYFKVQGARGDVFGMGGYRLKVDSGPVSEKQIAAIDGVLDGTNIQYVNFNHATATLSTANPLDQPVYQINPLFDYAAYARLNDAGDVNFYSVVTPATAPQALLFTVTAGQNSSLNPELTVYDASGNPVNAQILTNDAHSYVVQVLNPTANAAYYVAVSTDDFATTTSTLRGTYLLGVNYTNTPIVLETLVDDTLSATNTVDVYTLQSTEVQLYHFVMSVDTGGVATGVSVQLQITDQNNNTLLTLNCQDGETLSADLALNQGLYTARFVGLGLNGTLIPLTNYQLLGISLTDPLDPIAVDPTTISSTPTTPTPPPPPPATPDPSTLTVLAPTSNPLTPPPLTSTTT